MSQCYGCASVVQDSLYLQQCRFCDHVYRGRCQHSACIREILLCSFAGLGCGVEFLSKSLIFKTRITKTMRKWSER